MALADLKIYSEKSKPEIGYEWVQEEVLVDIFRSASNKISKTWRDGLHENLTPDLTYKLTKIEEELNQMWLGCRIGKNSLQDFKFLINEWVTVNGEIIENKKFPPALK